MYIYVVVNTEDLSRDEICLVTDNREKAFGYSSLVYPNAASIFDEVWVYKDEKKIEVWTRRSAFNLDWTCTKM